MKKGFTVVEIIVVIIFMIGLASFLIPVVLDNTKQARLTLEWRNIYQEIQYVFSIIDVQMVESKKIKDISLLRVPKSKQIEVKTEFLFSMIRPSLRLKNGVDNQLYKPTFMNGTSIPVDSAYYFDNYYFNSDEKIVGIKWDLKSCLKAEVCGKILVDVNGINPPNAWGRDIFGMDVFDTKLEPFGKAIGESASKRECLLKDNGTACSYYCLVGGHFD